MEIRIVEAVLFRLETAQPGSKAARQEADSISGVSLAPWIPREDQGCVLAPQSANSCGKLA